MIVSTVLIRLCPQDYLGRGVVGQQTLNVIEDNEDSLVKVAFHLYEPGDDDTETQPAPWRHALRPRTADPVFPAEKASIQLFTYCL